MQRDSVMEANRKALQEVLATATVRDSTRYLLEGIYLGTKPCDAAVVDFGIDSAQHLYALAVPVLKGEITPQQLDQALGNGPLLTRHAWFRCSLQVSRLLASMVPLLWVAR